MARPPHDVTGGRDVSRRRSCPGAGVRRRRVQLPARRPPHQRREPEATPLVDEERVDPPSYDRGSLPSDLLSFLDLISLEVVSRIRSAGVSLQKIRLLESELRRFRDVERPFAHEVLRVGDDRPRRKTCASGSSRATGRRPSSSRRSRRGYAPAGQDRLPRRRVGDRTGQERARCVGAARARSVEAALAGSSEARRSATGL